MGASRNGKAKVFPLAGAALLATCVSGAFAGTPPPQPASKSAEAPNRKTSAIRPGAVAGTVLQVDGKAPVVGARVRLRDDAGVLVAEVVTDKAGHFDAGKQPAGRYRIEIGRAQGWLDLDEKASARSILLVLPASVALAVEPAAGEDTVSLLGVDLTITQAVLVAAGGVAVIGGATTGIVLATQGGGSGGGAPPSPTK